MDTSDLARRMKESYESVPKSKLMRRTPVAIRLDGKAFHSFTRGFQKPYDEIFISAMQKTMRFLCQNIQGCVFGYTQSDEISLILVDYKTLESGAWFDYDVQKMTSISASMATMFFNKSFAEEVAVWTEQNRRLNELTKTKMPEETKQILLAYKKAVEKGAMFDSRVFNIPKEEVTNLIYWRQLDAIRNSTLMLGQANYSHSQLQGKSCAEIREMLDKEKNIRWNTLPGYLQRGSICVKESGGGWVIDKNPPVFKGVGRGTIETRINF